MTRGRVTIRRDRPLDGSRGNRYETRERRPARADAPMEEANVTPRSETDPSRSPAPARSGGTSETFVETRLGPGRLGRPSTTSTIPPHVGALVAWACAENRPGRQQLRELLGASQKHVENVLVGRKGLKPSALEAVVEAVSPRSSSALSAVTSGWLGNSVDELRQLRTCEAPVLADRILRSGLDLITLRARVRSRERVHALRARLEALGDSVLAVGDQRLAVRAWARRGVRRNDDFAPGYQLNVEFRDVRDETLVATIGVGLIQGIVILGDRVRLEVKGQGCLRGYLSALLALLPPEDLVARSWDADVAVDLDAPCGALMIFDRRGRASSQRVRPFAPFHTGGTALESGLELGSRRSGVSVTLYDKLAQIDWALRVADPTHELTPLAAQYARPPGRYAHATRLEVRVRGATSLASLLQRLRDAGARYRVADLRRAVIADGVDETLLVRGREHGFSHRLPSADVARGLVVEHRAAAHNRVANRGAAAPSLAMHRGLGADVLLALMLGGCRNRTARAHARAIVTRVAALLGEAADATAFDLAAVVTEAAATGLSELRRRFG